MKTPKSLQKFGRALGFDTDLDKEVISKPTESAEIPSESPEQSKPAFSLGSKPFGSAEPKEAADGTPTRAASRPQRPNRMRPSEKAKIEDTDNIKNPNKQAEQKPTQPTSAVQKPAQTTAKKTEQSKTEPAKTEPAPAAKPEKLSEKLTDIKPIIEKTVTGTTKVRDYVSENFTVFIGGFICIIIVLIVAVLAAINWGGMKTRVVSIAEITGNVTLDTGTRTVTASKNTKLAPSDILTLSENARVRLKIDPDIFVTVAGGSSLSLDYSNIEGQGDIAVNLLYGSAITEMQNEIGAKDTFTIATPNAIISARDSVFRTTFDYIEDGTKTTDVDNFSGNLTLQLFDDDGERFDNPMIQGPKTTARLITTPASTGYGSLNADLNLQNLPRNTLTEVLRISNSFKPLAYSTIELNDALRFAAQRDYTTTTISLPETVTVTPFEPILPPPVTLPPPVEEDLTPPETTVSEPPVTTIPTTRTAGQMTSYTGEKWWEIPNTGGQ